MDYLILYFPTSSFLIFSYVIILNFRGATDGDIDGFIPSWSGNYIYNPNLVIDLSHNPSRKTKENSG